MSSLNCNTFREYDLDPLQQRIQNLDGGRILDVATGRGASARYLLDTFQSFQELIGIDISEKNLVRARQDIADKHTGFLVMPAEKMAFDDNTFDTACISNSLHHVEDARQVLREMKRVLKPGGLLIVGEMFRDNQSELQMTHVLMHHWWAEIDEASGIPHYATFTRSELEGMISELEFAGVEFFDYRDDAVITDEEMLNFLHTTCDDYLGRAEKDLSRPDLVSRGIEIKNRLQNTGIAWATQLCVLGRK